jgi:hypothetical protein
MNCRKHATALCIALAAAVGGSMIVQSREEPLMAAEASKTNLALAHNVYFTLNEGTPQNREKLIAACKKYLVNHPGVLLFACGTLSDLDRPVNDRAFDVGLHIVFKDRAAHDRYQTSPDHLQFIDENRADWKQVRVFDSDVEIIAPRSN